MGLLFTVCYSILPQKGTVCVTIYPLLYIFMACIIKHRGNFIYAIQAKKIVIGMKTLEGSIPTVISLYMFFR